MSSRVETNNKQASTATKKKIQLVRDNVDSDSDSSFTEPPPPSSASASKKNHNTPVSSSSDLKVTGRHISSSKKESLESLQKNKLQKQKESSSNIRAVTTTAPPQSEPNPYEEQNRCLAIEVDRCRHAIFLKDERINEINSENYQLREYTNAVELELIKLREIIQENTNQIKQLQSHNANLIGALSSAALINNPNDSTNNNSNNMTISVNNDEFNLSGDPNEAFKQFLSLFPKINAEFSFKITQLNKLASILFSQNQSILNNTANTSHASRPSLSTSINNRSKLNSSGNIIDTENNTSITRQSAKIDESMPGKISTVSPNSIKIYTQNQAAQLRHIKESQRENNNRYDEDQEEEKEDEDEQENDDDYEEEEDDEEDEDNEEEEVEDANQNVQVNEEIQIEEDLIIENEEEIQRMELLKRQQQAMALAADKARLSIIYDTEEADEEGENEDQDDQIESASEEEQFEEAQEDLVEESQEEEEDDDDDDDDDDDEGEDEEDEDEDEDEEQEKVQDSEDEDDVSEEEVDEGKVTIDDTVEIEQKSPDLNNTANNTRSKRRSSIKAVSFHETVIPNTQESPKTIQPSQNNSTLKKSYFELENRPVRINPEVEDTRTLSVRKRNAILSKTPASSSNTKDINNTKENETTNARKSILKPFNASEINIISNETNESTLPPPPPPPPTARKSTSGVIRDRRRSKVFSTGGDEPLGPGGSLLLQNVNEHVERTNIHEENVVKSPLQTHESNKNNNTSPIDHNQENVPPKKASALPPKPPKSIFKSKQQKQDENQAKENIENKRPVEKQSNNDVKSYLEDICDDAADSDALTNKSKPGRKSKSISKPPKPPKPPTNKKANDEATKENQPVNKTDNNKIDDKNTKQAKRTIESVYSPVTQQTPLENQQQHVVIIDESSNDSFKSVNSKGNTSQDQEPKSPPSNNQIISINKKIRLTPADAGSSLLLSCEGSARRNKKPISYKELPLNVKMRRDKFNKVHTKQLECKVKDVGELL